MPWPKWLVSAPSDEPADAPAPSTPAGVEAVVTHGRLVELFNADGLPIYVPESDAESWLRQGLTRELYDVDAEVAAIGPLFDSARNAVVAHWASARAAGSVQREAESMVAVAASTQLTAAYGRLMFALERHYPHQEPEAPAA